MRISYTRPTWSHEASFVNSLLTTARDLGHAIVPDPKTADLHVQWGARDAPPRKPTLFVELGWLPRWYYQVSHRGINADHHLAQPKLEPIDAEQRWKAEVLLRTIREGRGAPGHWGYLYIGETPPTAVAKLRYILAPLQMEIDTNMEHVPLAMRTNQGFVDAVTEHVERHLPELPIVFKQHPHSQARPQLDLEMRRRGDKVYPHRQASVYAYLKDPRCVAVVTANSNVANDGLLFDKPSVVFGRGIWPGGVFLKTLAHLDAWQVGAEMRLMYVYWLSKVQWTLRDASDAMRVDGALRDASAP